MAQRLYSVESFAKTCGSSRTAVLRAIAGGTITPVAFLVTRQAGDLPLLPESALGDFVRVLAPPKTKPEGIS